MPTALADPDILTRRVREMVGAGRLLAARPLLAALRSMGVAAAETAEIEGRLLLREGRLAEALAVLDAALAGGAVAALHVCRAEARMQADDTVGAAADAAEAVILDRADPQAKAVLGVALIELGRPDEALPCLRSAIAALPDRVAYRQALAAAEERCGDPEMAAATLAAAIARAPGQSALCTAAIMLAMRRRDFTTAAALAEAARQDGVADACVFGLRGHALSSLGRHTEAASGVLPQALRAPAEYLETVFDGYASRFEQHLIGLGYRVPGLIRAALLAELDLSAGPVGPVLDLGCGTGLMAVVLSDLALRPLVGVDLSAGMLAEARAKGLYQALVQQDLEAFLDAPGPAWPVILAADVFCYFGALDGALARLAARLAPGGLCLFSVELADGDDWQLGRQGRYRHAEAHVLAALASAGLHPLRCVKEVLRHDADAAVNGLLVVARHAG
jgi:predicted TPR repeat methyltransferase